MTEVLAVTGTGNYFLTRYIVCIGKSLTKATNSTMTTFISTFHTGEVILVNTCLSFEVGVISSGMAQLELRNLDLDFLGILD